MDTAKIRNVRIGDVLKEYGYVTEEDIQAAIAYQKSHKGVRIGNALIQLGIVTERQTLEALAERLRMKYVEISDVDVDVQAVSKIPQALAENYLMLGVHLEKGNLSVIMNDPMNYYGIEDVRQATGCNLEILLSEKEPLEQAISYYYSEVAAQMAATKANRTFREEELEDAQIDDLDGDDTPVVNLLNSLVQRAYSVNASDIHIEPFEDKTLMRMRIDGVILDYVQLQKSMHASLIARIKILGELDIAERRIPQDGHFRMKLDSEQFNIRVSTIPTVFGEKAVLRLLGSNAVVEHAESFGMNQEDFQLFSRMLTVPNGMIYVTGPTGSGKSTTLYMVLEALSHGNVNISTIEDPVEKNITRINQMQVNNTAGLTFEIGLRALLRQDPDIIMVGETRDYETASIAVRAAITGHQVFSTLHTNDSASTVIRLVDMGLEPYMIASSLVGIVAQRLMRRVCPECQEDAGMSAREEAFVGRKLTGLKKGKGCPHCNYTGYRGRIAIHEILKIDAPLRKMITDGATVEEIREYAITQIHMKTLKQRGTELVEQGITTIEELMKVSYYE